MYPDRWKQVVPLVRHTLEHLLDRSAAVNKSHGHLQPFGVTSQVLRLCSSEFTRRNNLRLSAQPDTEVYTDRCKQVKPLAQPVTRLNISWNTVLLPE